MTFIVDLGAAQNDHILTRHPWIPYFRCKDHEANTHNNMTITMIASGHFVMLIRGYYPPQKVRPIWWFDKYPSKVICANVGDFLPKWTFRPFFRLRQRAYKSSVCLPQGLLSFFLQICVQYCVDVDAVVDYYKFNSIRLCDTNRSRNCLYMEPVFQNSEWRPDMRTQIQTCTRSCTYHFLLKPLQCHA